MEELPFIELNLAGTEFQATPLNASLFTFSKWATLEDGTAIANPQARNHAFLRTHSREETDNEVQRGTYIFEPETVLKLGKVMLRHGFPGRINQLTIQTCDENAYQQYADQITAYEAENLDDFIPDEWYNDGKESQ